MIFQHFNVLSSSTVAGNVALPFKLRIPPLLELVALAHKADANPSELSGGQKQRGAIRRAQFNLVLSPWLGLSTGSHLQDKLDQPLLHEPTIPIGAKATSAFLRRVVEFAGLDRARAEAFIAKE